MYLGSVLWIHKISSAILNNIIWSKKGIPDHGKGRNLMENMRNSVVSTVPADVLAPNGAKTSAGTVLTKFWFWPYNKDVHLIERLTLAWRDMDYLA